MLTDWDMQNEYEIYPEWRWRYAPGVTRNVEHVFGLRLPQPLPVTVAPARASWLTSGCRMTKLRTRFFPGATRRSLEDLPERCKTG